MKKKRWQTPEDKAFNRERNSTQAKNHRSHIWQRDGGRCRICGHAAKKVHHPFPFADYKALRNDMNNGYCVCDECGKFVDKKMEQRGGRPKNDS